MMKVIILFMCYLVTSILIVNTAFSQTINLQGPGKVKMKNGKIKTKGDIVIGDDTYMTKTFPVSRVSSVNLEASVDIEVYYSSESKVEIDADQNILDLFKVSSIGGKLNISSSKSYVSNNVINVRLYTNSLSSVTLSGSGDVFVNDLNSPSLSILLEGSGDIKVNGKTTTLTIRSQGAGDIDCSNLEADNVDIKLDGAGDIDVYASKFLKIYHDGAGDINYWGRPKTSIINEGVGDIFEN